MKNQEQQVHRLDLDTPDMKSIQEKLRKIAEESDDVKDGTVSVEDELKEPGYVLYGQILKSTTDILRTPDTKKLFDQLIKQFGEDTTASLMEFFAAAITQSSYNAVIFFNDLLKEELNKQFELMGNVLNNCVSDCKAHRAVLGSFGKRLTKLEGKNTVDEIKKNLNTSQPTE